MYNFENFYRANVKGIVVDAGHGGSDPGAIGNGLQEKDLTLQAAKYMYQRFKDLGIPVVITRDDDSTLTRDERVSKMVNSFGNGSDVLVLSNHINAGGGEGAEIVYPLRTNGNLAQAILDEIGNAGQKKRKIYQRTLPEDPSKDYYYIQRLTPNTTSLLIEYGFIDNASDVNKLKNNLLDYVEAVVKAVAEYAGVPYSNPNQPDISEDTGSYVVKSGDTLYGIANKFGVSLNDLKALNKLTSNLLQIGQVLLIPVAQGEETPTNTITYVVQRGDSLYSIAQKYGTTVATLRQLNNLTTDLLQIGQVLKVPQTGTSSSGNVYIVKRGDSLYSIASQYNTTVDAIKLANNLTSNIIQVGQQLIIPAKDAPSVTPDPDLDENEPITYVVQKGDTLYSIARRFGTTINQIISRNNLPNLILQIGQTLIIPQ